MDTISKTPEKKDLLCPVKYYSFFFFKKQWGERELTLNLPGLFTNLEPLDSSLLEIPCIKTLLEELSTYIKTDLVRLLRGQSQENDSLIVIFLKITALQVGYLVRETD